MDCRRYASLFFVSLGTLAGCLSQNSQQITPNPTLGTPQPSQLTERPRREADLPKIQPKAATCLAAGHAFETEADDPRCDPTSRERLRDQARRAYQQAIDVEPANTTAHRRLAGLYGKLDDQNRALATLQKGHQKSPNDAGICHDLGMWHARQKNWDAAIVALSRATHLEPENRAYNNTLGHCLARAGRTDESIACFQRTMGEAQAHYNVARMLAHMKKETEARAHLKHALQADPRMSVAQELLAALDGKGNLPDGEGILQAGFEPTLDPGRSDR